MVARVGEEFSRQCPGCGSDIRLIAFITEPRLIRKILIRLTRDARACIRLGAAHARRRTLATALQACARSMLPPLRHPGCASEATPASGHGQPLAASSLSTGFQPVCLSGSHGARGIIGCMCDSGRRSSRIGGTRRSRCDVCPAAVAPQRLSGELTRPAGAEHVAGRLRWPSNARGSRVTRISHAGRQAAGLGDIPR